MRSKLRKNEELKLVGTLKLNRCSDERRFKMNKKLILSIMPIMMFLMMFSVISATVSWSTPATSSQQNGNIAVKVFFVNETDITDPVSANTTVYWKTTGAWSAVTCGSFAQNGSQATCTIADGAIADASSVTLNVTLGNNTLKLGGVTSGAFTIDTTNPIMDAKETSIYTTEPINYKCSDALAVSSASVSYTNSAGSTVTDTLQAGTSDYVQFSKTFIAGTYTFTCTDGASNTHTDTVTVSTPSEVIGNDDNDSDSSDNKMVIFVVLAAAGIIIYLLKK